MAGELWDSIVDFLSPEARQRRGEWRDEKARDLGGLMQYYLGPGVDVESTVRAADMFNPVADVGRAMQSSEQMFAPGRTAGQRFESGVEMMTDVASVAAPAAAAGLLSRTGGNVGDEAGQAGEAVVDSLLGFMPGRGARAADEIAARANQRAPMPTMYSNPIDPDAYRGVHRAPGRTADGSTASLDDLTTIYPDDIYDRRVAARYYGHMEDPVADREMVEMFSRVRGRPDVGVPVYRAVPKDAPDTINPGDWVTPSRRYAEGHGQGPMEGEYKIIADTVPASDLFTDANSIFEFGYNPKPQGIRAYHGSPHDFDEFRMDRIGSGEGAQAYGHGLYFAENEGVARSYRDQLAKGPDTPAGNVWDLVNNYGQKPEELRPVVEDMVRYAPNEQMRANAEEMLRVVDDGSWRDVDPGGRMYEVNINANPEDFLDWDAPLSEQPESVRQAFVSVKSQGDPTLRELLDTSPEGMMLQGMVPNAQGSAAYRTLSNDIASSGVGPGPSAERIAAQELRDAGIPGVRYRDAGSRGAAEGTSNYVVFDENIIDIVRKYGIAGAATMLGMSQADVAQAMQQQPGLLGDTRQQNAQSLYDYLAPFQQRGR